VVISMSDLLTLGALAFWLGLWAARELGWCGVTRGQASAAARRGQQRPRSRSDSQGGPDGPYVDAFGQRS